MNSPPEKSAQGFYILRCERNFLYWLAWKSWLRDALGMTFFPMVLNGLDPWPPETQEKADRTAKYYNDIRVKIKWSKAVPEHPRPWRRWSQEEMNAFEAAEMARRHAEGGYFPMKTFDGKLEPREGFWRAPIEEHRKAEYENEQTDAWFKARIRESMVRDPGLADRKRGRVREPEPEPTP